MSFKYSADKHCLSNWQQTIASTVCLTRACLSKCSAVCHFRWIKTWFNRQMSCCLWKFSFNSHRATNHPVAFPKGNHRSSKSNLDHVGHLPSNIRGLAESLCSIHLVCVSWTGLANFLKSHRDVELGLHCWDHFVLCQFVLRLTWVCPSQLDLVQGLALLALAPLWFEVSSKVAHTLRTAQRTNNYGGFSSTWE